MSSTSVKIKASPARSRPRDAPDKLAGTGAGGTPAVIAGPGAAPEGDAAEQAPAPAQSTHDAADRPKSGSVMATIGKCVKPYLEKHGHALAYGIVGLVAAVLILTIGFWPVLLLAVLIGLGIAIGRYRDGDPQMRARARALTGFLRR